MKKETVILILKCVGTCCIDVADILEESKETYVKPECKVIPTDTHKIL